MTARVLVVDDVPANIKILEAKLTADYFTVLTADDGTEALDLSVSQAPDIILLDVMMPGMDGFETCRRLKKNPETAHIPVVMVTALSDAADRVEGLEAGADDFLTKPVNDLTLFARIRSLARMKRAMDEWRLREETCDRFGVMDNPYTGDGAEVHPGRILVVEPDELSGERLAAVLEEEGHEVVCTTNEGGAMDLAGSQAFDLIVTSLYLEESDGLRLCAQLRTLETCRTTPVLLVIEQEEVGGLVKGFELGISDYLIRPIDPNELKARTRTQLRQKRCRERLQENYRRSLAMALTDGLTGLYNHRYFCSHLETAYGRARAEDKPLCLLMVDVDHFKSVNDTYGHTIGDRVLQELGDRLSRNLREFDMAARFGGEEFAVVMPECRPDVAYTVAERLRTVVAGDPFLTTGGEEIQVTVSIGIACSTGPETGVEALIARADEALYAAKSAGRNRVVRPMAASELRRAVG